MNQRSNYVPSSVLMLALLAVCGGTWPAAKWAAAEESTEEIRLLFLGDQGHHHPAARFQQLQPVLAQQGISLTYTDRVDDLRSDVLTRYHGLMIYANIARISSDQEEALLSYVEDGKGLIALHCASYCFLNSPAYVGLVGAQFQRHGAGVFRTTPAETEHSVMRGFAGFESWDETYVHHQHHEENRTVLSYRIDEQGREPWTWVRTQGKGRVFYTAWGHDERTWSHPGFHNLVERGIRWAVGDDPSTVPDYQDAPRMTELPTDPLEPFEYQEAEIPFYPAGEKWGALGEPIRQMQKPLPPSESQARFVTPVGFEVQPFASEPEIGKPICMTWDHRGRLWIAETVDYPNDQQPEGSGNDRIRICEDTDGDGRADKFTVFADGLSIPTSLAMAGDGVIVHQAPETLLLRDTDGDDVADERRVLFRGWSASDTHAGPSNLQYGLDNWYYGMVGYAGFEGTVAGEAHSFRTGFYRFRMDRSSERVEKLEFLRNTNNNSWGVSFNEEGILFGSTANGNPSVYMPIPNRYYESVRGWSSTVLGGIAQSDRFSPITDKVRQVDYHGRFTAAAGHAIYTARSWPREYWNRAAFVNGPTGHLTATFLLQPFGADYRSRNAWNLLASDDEWTAPIMAEVGPDGQVWVIDWYNYIVQHNPTPAGYETGKGNAYKTKLRDKQRGRIYRVVSQRVVSRNAKVSDPPPLSEATPQQLVDALAHPNMLWRRHAQRLLVERSETGVKDPLLEMVKTAEVDELGLAPGAIHALWTLHGLGLVDGADAEVNRTVVAAGLAHRSAGVRRAAVSVLPRTPAMRDALLRSAALSDVNGQVRLAALLALSEMPAADTSDPDGDPESGPDSLSAAGAIVEALQDPRNLHDRWLPDAATSAAATHARQFLEQLATVAEPSPVLLKTAAIVSEHFARQGPSREVVDVLAALQETTPPLADAVVGGVAAGWPQEVQPVHSDRQEEALVGLLTTLSPGTRGHLVRLATAWGMKRFESHAGKIAETLLSTVADQQLKDEARMTAARQLMEFQPHNADYAAELLEMISPRTSPELAEGLLSAVATSQAEEVGTSVAAAFRQWTPAIRPAALRLLLRRTPWTLALLDAVEQGRIPLNDLTLDQKQALSSHPRSEIAERARKIMARGGGLPDPDRQKVLEELLPLTRQAGDVALGQAVYKKQCAKCHVYRGEGTKIGPDLTGMAVHPKHELLTQILDPSRSVEGNYRVYTVATVDGRVMNGLLASENKTAIELYDAEGKKHVLLREDIDELIASPKSLMPEGFEKQVPPEDLVNLLEFLTQRGRYLPLPLEKAATIVSTRGMFHRQDAEAERLIFPDWSPKTVESVPFLLVDPQGDRQENVVLLHGPRGTFPPRMPKSVTLPCNSPAAAIHLLSGVSGWGFPLGEKNSVSMIVRLHYADGSREDHPLRNGVHFADYIRRVDVPESKFAFALRNQQIRYLAVHPERQDTIEKIELVKGPDATSPVVMAVTVETAETSVE